MMDRPDGVTAAKLFVIAVGNRSALDRVEPLLAVIGQKTFRFDEDPAPGNSVKIATNFMLTAVIESMAEALALVRKSGIDPEEFLEFLTGSLFGYAAVCELRRYDRKEPL